MQPSRDISRLIEIMAALRRPGTGCGWDIEQTFESIVPYTIEEAHEMAIAVARGNKVPLALHALTYAVKLQTKSSSVGFDWNGARLVLAKIREET